jgi:hypothetical protein
MSMHNSINIGKLLVDLAVYASFSKPLWRIFLDRLGIFNLIFDNIIGTLHQCWWEVSGHVEVGMVIRVANTDMAIGVENAMAVENVGACYEAPVLEKESIQLSRS